MSSEFRAPLFGPASSSSSSLPRSASQHSLMGNLPPDSIDLGDIFDDHFFPDDLDFTAFFQDMEAGAPGLAHSKSMNSSMLPQSSIISTSKGSFDQTIKVPLPIRMPNIALNNVRSSVVKNESKATPEEIGNQNKDGNSETFDALDNRGLDGTGDGSNYNSVGGRGDRANDFDTDDINVKQKLERRERNREHAKRSRIRKKVLLDSLQDELLLVREENIKLRRIVADKIPHMAHSILEHCTALESSLLSTITDGSEDTQDIPKLRSMLNMETERATMIGEEVKQHAKILMEPDYRLIHSLVISQQNFVLSDPSLPDNPIVYASEGFCKLSGYKRDEILGRNCRFLQGPGTDQAAVEVIREGVAAGKDISVCLLNYKADGTPFWNQFFVGALRDSEGNVVNFVGVQCEVNIVPVTEIKDRVKKLPIPDF